MYRWWTEAACVTLSRHCMRRCANVTQLSSTGKRVWFHRLTNVLSGRHSPFLSRIDTSANSKPNIKVTIMIWSLSCVLPCRSQTSLQLSTHVAPHHSGLATHLRMKACWRYCVTQIFPCSLRCHIIE
jgi:hypothetical protein